MHSLFSFCFAGVSKTATLRHLDKYFVLCSSTDIIFKSNGLFFLILFSSSLVSLFSSLLLLFVIYCTLSTYFTQIVLPFLVFISWNSFCFGIAFFRHVRGTSFCPYQDHLSLFELEQRGNCCTMFCTLYEKHYIFYSFLFCSLVFKCLVSFL